MWFAGRSAHQQEAAGVSIAAPNSPPPMSGVMKAPSRLWERPWARRPHLDTLTPTGLPTPLGWRLGLEWSLSPSPPAPTAYSGHSSDSHCCLPTHPPSPCLGPASSNVPAPLLTPLTAPHCLWIKRKPLAALHSHGGSVNSRSKQLAFLSLHSTLTLTNVAATPWQHPASPSEPPL